MSDCFNTYLFQVKVAPKCIVTLRFVIYQCNLYQRAAKQLRTFPKSSTRDETFDLFLSIIHYLAAVVTAFSREATADESSFTSTWRSAHLDYYLALVIHDSAFTPTLQNAALKKMKRSWNDFTKKKGYAKVAQSKSFGQRLSCVHMAIHATSTLVTAELLHKTICTTGGNLCGGPFSHKHSDDEVIAQFLETVPSSEPAPETNGKGKKKAVDVDDVDESVEVAPNKRHTVRATTVPSATSQGSSNLMQVDVEAVDSPVQSRRPGLRSNKFNKDGRRKGLATVEGSGKMRDADALHTEEEVGEQCISRVTSEISEQSPADQIAGQYEFKQNARKSPKNRKSARPTKTSNARGKKKAVPIVIESEDEERDTSSVPEEVTSIWKVSLWCCGMRLCSPTHDFVQEEPSNVSPPSVSTLISDNTTHSESHISKPAAEDFDSEFPSLRHDWDSCTKDLWDNGHSPVFLKLAAWMLIRFRHLSKTDIEAEIARSLIPESPRVMDFKDDDDYFEALGIERLYTAIVHMDTRPRYLAHLMHAMGKVISELDVGQSHPRVWPVSSPPSVQEKFVIMLQVAGG
jgi:hypothetical protein